MAKPREKATVSVPVDAVSGYISQRESQGWRLDAKGKPIWSQFFRQNRVPLTFSRPAP